VSNVFSDQDPDRATDAERDLVLEAETAARIDAAKSAAKIAARGTISYAIMTA
jgi:hypothetical protein